VKKGFNARVYYLLLNEYYTSNNNINYIDHD